MSKHTPGPWTTYRTKTGGWLVYAPNGIKNPCPEGQLIANCGVTALAATLEELNANTDLIAAAPEMLEALKLIIKEKAPSYHDCLDNGEPECEWCIAMNAIAKAEGKL